MYRLKQSHCHGVTSTIPSIFCFVFCCFYAYFMISPLMIFIFSFVSASFHYIIIMFNLTLFHYIMGTLYERAFFFVCAFVVVAAVVFVSFKILLCLLLFIMTIIFMIISFFFLFFFSRNIDVMHDVQTQTQTQAQTNSIKSFGWFDRYRTGRDAPHNLFSLNYAPILSTRN